MGCREIATLSDAPPVLRLSNHVIQEVIDGRALGGGQGRGEGVVLVAPTAGGHQGDGGVHREDALDAGDGDGDLYVVDRDREGHARFLLGDLDFGDDAGLLDLDEQPFVVGVDGLLVDTAACGGGGGGGGRVPELGVVLDAGDVGPDPGP